MCKKKVSRRTFGPKGDRQDKVTGRIRQLNKNYFCCFYSAKYYYGKGKAIPVPGRGGP
jgi:hypothetical protein